MTDSVRFFQLRQLGFGYVSISGQCACCREPISGHQGRDHRCGRCRRLYAEFKKRFNGVFREDRALCPKVRAARRGEGSQDRAAEHGGSA
jgi:hypothetical protein